ncbi:uncharacterized protein LOC116130529 isoform X1 [Pistacia vera]|uniref:uncharacterized protein LOC116130529 isoform X1 n=1 Tax=Pistacia vera TaxID=55513 RepID=UPI001262BF65|nr:uncharacterized protein LOC116130529 isoform X1 [Pistacia vera]
MGKRGTRLPNFCLNRIRPLVRVRSPPIQSKPTAKSDVKCENSGIVNGEEKCSSDGVKPGLVNGRKIMIVVDSSSEAKGAIQWSLTHTVQSHDKVILLYVIKPSNQDSTAGGESSKKMERSAPRAYQLVHNLKNMCQQKRPDVQLEVAVVEGKEKGPAILEEAKKQGVSLLVLGQKKRSTTWRLIMMWAGNRVPVGVVEYCIQNAACMAVAVRRKGKKQGGYLITTKRHKDFWLLA